eukprot:808778-Pyramimonas_sp.AAC.1
MARRTPAALIVLSLCCARTCERRRRGKGPGKTISVWSVDREHWWPRFGCVWRSLGDSVATCGAHACRQTCYTGPRKNPGPTFEQN